MEGADTLLDNEGTTLEGSGQLSGDDEQDESDGNMSESRAGVLDEARDKEINEDPDQSDGDGQGGDGDDEVNTLEGVRWS